MEVTARQATASDAPFLAHVMYDSMTPGVGHGIFDAALEGTGVSPVDFNEACLLSGASNWGQIESFIVLVTDGYPQAGAMGSFLSSNPDPRPLTAEGFAAVSKHLGWTPLVARDFWRKYVAFYGFFGNSPTLQQPAEYVLEFSSVNPDLRGHGLYGKLLDAHLQRARSMNFKTMGGAAVFGNDSVIRALLKWGFYEVKRFGPEDYGGGFPGMIRYVYDVPEST